ncbi:MAG: hypothetical protein EOO02_00270, partial [Chitinophagaceae bacterium]
MHSLLRKKQILSAITFIIAPAVLIFSAFKQADHFGIVQNAKDKRVDITIDGQPFTSYIYPDSLMKSVLYPLHTSKGTLITRGWPMDPRSGERIDHPHHV